MPESFSHHLLAELPARVDVEVEVSRFAIVKRGADGLVDFVSPLPCPYNYGSIPGRVGGDGDPLDALVLGPRRRLGRAPGLWVVGVVDFVDAGATDLKVICSPVRGITRRQVRGVGRFFLTYARFKSLLNAARGRKGPTRFCGVVIRDFD